MRTLEWSAVLFLWLTGCDLFDRGDKQVNVPIQTYVEAADQVLPNGVVGQPYDATVVATGGEPPYSWTAAPDAVVPKGLVISGDGHVAGTPAEAGEFEFAVIVNDIAGREARVELSLTVGIEPRVVGCGDTISGVFRDDAYGTDGRPDLTDIENLEWLAVAVPNDLTTRVDLVFRNDALTVLYVELPNLTVGSGDLDTDYVPYTLNNGSLPQTVSIDAGSDPSLTGFLTQPTIPLLLLAQTAGEWEMSVECSDGPIFVVLPQYPTRLGDPLEIDFDVYGNNEGVRIWTDDPLPAWMIWDEATGQVSGIAAQPGAWEFTVHAETLDGRTRSERSIIGVYEVVDVACGESIPYRTTESYLDGEFIAFYDPRGFGVFRVPLAEAGDVSSVSFSVGGESSHYLGQAMPNPDWLRFYGGAERIYDNGVQIMTVDPTTFPASRHYLDPLVGELYFSAGSIDYGPADLDIQVECDTNPRPDFPMLPVIQPLTASSFQLEAIGGQPPYTWSASGLPNGIVLSPSGELSGQTGALGTYDVAVTLTDKFGGFFQDTYRMYVGNDEACAGYTQMQCGDSIDGEFTLAFYQDDSGDASTEVLCVVNNDLSSLSFEVYADDLEIRLDIVDPARTAEDMFVNNQGSPNYGTYKGYVAFDSVDGVGVDEFSWPGIDDFEDIPLLFTLRAYDPGTWTVHLTCP